MQKVKMIFLVMLGIFAIGVAAIVAGTIMSGAKNPPLSSAELKLGGQTFEVELARSIGERVRGLSGRESLGEREGMLFIFGTPALQNFWMKDMKFPIDIIWINGNKIVGFAENAQPEESKKTWGLKIYSSSEPADKVLEVLAGTVSGLGIRAGDEIGLPF